MRTWLLLLFLTLIAGLFIGTLIGFDNGYVLISWDKYSVETSVGLFLLGTVIAVAILYVLLRLVQAILESGGSFSSWRSKRRALRVKRQTIRGIISMSHGRWKQAERMLTLNAADAQVPLVNYLAAARAAFEQDKPEAVDQWLKAAVKSTKGAELAVGITQVDILNSRGQKEQALAVLLRLYQSNPKHPHLLKLLSKLYMELEDWQALQRLIPDIRRYTKIPADKVQELEDRVSLQTLERIAHSQGSSNPVAELKTAYNNLGRASRYKADIAKRYIELLIKLNAEQTAEQELRGILKNVWHDDLIHLYGKIEGEDNGRQLLFAEQQLSERPNDPVLLWALGELALRQHDLDKAISYLQTGLSIRNLPELHTSMAKVRIAEGDEVLACEHFQLALES
ncbi:MAG: heme biosynthesis HemY N-terminal domain-containing protein [Venatoribacter sp.]